MVKNVASAILLSVIGATPVIAKDIVWARYGDIDTLDPHRSTSTLSMQIWNQIYELLLARDADGKIGPNLAKSYQVSDDGLQVTFTLQDGIKCHESNSIK